MRALILLFLGWGAWAEELRFPPAHLFVVAATNFEEVIGRVDLNFVDPRTPSCAMVFAREKFLEKQIQEIESTTDRGETAELIEFRGRLLQLRGMLSRPWVQLSARFEIGAEATQAVRGNKFGIGFDLASRSWVSRQGFLPEDVHLKAERNELVFNWTWDAYQYCGSQSGLTMRLDI